MILIWTIVWSHLYSYSFEPNPDWSHEYSGQEEILQYLIRVAQKWGLFQKIRFNTGVSAARWDDTAGHWKIDVQVTGDKEAEFGRQYSINADYLVSAVGQLNMPSYPEVPHLDSFKGKIMHSARWDWSYSMKGKRVAVIGNGATAAQIVPEVAKVCDTLTVFQRTANWIAPKANCVIDSKMRTAYRYIPGLRKAYRARLMDIRESIYQANVVGNSDAKQDLKNACLQMLVDQIPDNPALRENLIPTYPPGCKRVIASDDFLSTLNQPQVTLETSKIINVMPTGLTVEGDSEHVVDVIVFATGFRTLEFMYPIKIYGLGGVSLDAVWKKGTKAYLGISVEAMPNFAMLYGPNTNLGHNSVILMVEAQSRYISAMISTLLAPSTSDERLHITVKPTSVAEYNTIAQERLKLTSFANPACHSWYKAADGTVTNNWYGTVVEYQEKVSTINWLHYDIETVSGRRVIREKQTYIGRVVEESRYTRYLYAISTVFAVLAFKQILG